MKKSMKKYVAGAALAALFIAGSAFAGAFGIEQGTPISKLNVTRVVNDSTPYKTYRITVPMPNDEFSLYNVSATDSTGVCKITAIGKSYTNDGTGATIRGVFNRFKTALTAKYGKSTDFDYLHANASLSAPTQFADSLKADQRSLVSYWDSDSTKSLPSDIQSISLRATSIETNETYIVVAYELGNFDACWAQRPKDTGAGL